MEQQKIGAFLRQLRRERNLTQEQLAEVLGVSNRSVSRWENGATLPDLGLLVELADYYQVDLGELIRGERCDMPAAETAGLLADYSSQEKARLTRRLRWIFLAGVLAMVFYMVLDVTGLRGQTAWESAADFALGLAAGILALGVLATSPAFRRIAALKRRHLARSREPGRSAAPSRRRN